MLLLLVAVLPLVAQNGYANSVAVGGGDVFVLKPRAGQGPATVYVYRMSADGTWQVAERLRPAGGDSTGEAFSPSMTLSDGTLLVGGSDPEVEWGADVFRRGAGTAWIRAGKLSLVSTSGDAAWDLAALMRILQPPRRVVAADGNRALVAVVGGPRSSSGVRVFERESGGGGSDRWLERARFERSDAEGNDEFGAALALAGDVALVGAPKHGESGAVYVFVRNPGSGEWRQEVKLLGVDVPTNAAFGTAVAFDGDVALIGVPGTPDTAGVVIAYQRDPATGTWTEWSRVMPSPPDGSGGDLFGTALALASDELLIGAPGADEERGRVHRFVRDADTGRWRAAGAIVAPGVKAGFRLGTSCGAAAAGRGAGGRGGAAGRGRAAGVARGADGGWGEGCWWSLSGGLEAIAGGEVRCDEGHAGQFECSDVDLLAFLPVSALGGAPGTGVSDVWGWTDPVTGREYALVARAGGVAAVDITEPSAPTYLGVLSAGGGSALDIKVYKDYAFFIGGGNASQGMLIFDLTRLRDSRNAPATFEPDARYEGIASAHNLIIDTESGFAYIVGSSGGGETCGGGLHMVDIRDPINPTFVGCYTDTEGLIWQGRTHDGQCVEYHGPDENFQGRQICFASNETALRIVDVTDKSNPVPLAAATYPGMAYVHQGWLTDDQRYFYMDDELDELTGLTQRTRTLVWDVAELDDPVLVGEYFGPTGATDHNLYIKGNRMYQANYQAGLRVVDISDPKNPVEIGFFDTTPYEGNPPGFNGAWTAFPFFESGTVIVSSMGEGLFILRPVRRPVLVP